MNLHAGCNQGAVRRPYRAIQKVQTPCAARYNICQIVFSRSCASAASF
jgi:hypothetical protein